MKTVEEIELIEERFKQRYKLKKAVNMIISEIITVLGVVSFNFIWNYDNDVLLTFRWMTVDGTVYTTLISFVFVIVDMFEIIRYTELTKENVYFMRLSAAVAEGLIFCVVLLSQLPISPEHMHIFRFDMFNMHIVIPILMIGSFIFNDSPLGKLSFIDRLRGCWFVTIYALIILILILTGIIPSEQIPYFFLDVYNMPYLTALGCFGFIYALSLLLSLCLSELNRKLSWVWFKGIN